MTSTALAAGFLVYMVSAKVSHHRGDRLRILLPGIGKAWSSAFSGRPMTRAGYVGQVRAWDFTYGGNGWHPHIHSLLFFDPATSPGTAEDWIRERGAKYVERLAVAGLGAALDERGWHYSRCSTAEEASRYLVKAGGPDGSWGAGLELARSDIKKSKPGGGRNPWELLESAADGNVADGELWREYEQATLGMRQIVTGRRLAKQFGCVALVEESDVEAASVAPADEVVAEVVLSASEWNWLVESGHTCEVFEHLQTVGRERVQARERLRNVAGVVTELVS